MNKKIIYFGFLFTFLFSLSLAATVEKEFDEKIATDPIGHGVNLIFTKAEVESAFGEKNFFNVWVNQKESTFLHQALLIEDEKVRKKLVKSIIVVRDLDVKTLLEFKDQAGKTPFDLAREKSDQVSIYLFLHANKRTNDKPKKDQAEKEVKPPERQEESRSFLTPSLIALFIAASCCSAYTFYEWYEDYSELSGKNKESEVPLTKSELRTLAWEKTKERFFEFFE